MIVPLTFLLLAATPAPSAPAAVRSDPPVKVWLTRDDIRPGDWARVKVRVGQDGYLLVLASDVAGRVRVLFPLDPGADAQVRAGRTLDLRGSGSAGSFLVGDTPGAGVVLAARTSQPLRFTGFVTGGHWDLAALDSAARGPGGSRGNPDEMLLGVAQQIAGGNQLDYDAATYTVGGGRSDVASRDRRYIDQGYADGGYDYYDYGYAYPSWYGYGCFDPFFCSPAYAAIQFGFFYSPFYARPYYYRPYIRPFYPRTYGPYYGGRGYVGKTYIPTRPPVQYRNRGNGYSPVRSFGGAPARPAYAPPRFAPPRMAMPSFRGGGGGGNARGGGGRRR